MTSLSPLDTLDNQITKADFNLLKFRYSLKSNSYLELYLEFSSWLLDQSSAPFLRDQLVTTGHRGLKNRRNYYFPLKPGSLYLPGVDEEPGETIQLPSDYPLAMQRGEVSWLQLTDLKQSSFSQIFVSSKTSHEFMSVLNLPI